MNTEQLHTYLSALGRFHHHLVAERIIPLDQLQEVYPDAWDCFLEPEPGLYLSFWNEDKRFEAVMICLAETTPLSVVYQQPLPEPYDQCINREATLATLGTPIKSRGPFRMPSPLDQVGGWDHFDLAPLGYPGLKVIAKYDVALNVTGLVFSVEKNGHERLQEEVQANGA